MLTRSIPNKKILEIAIQMKCHFVSYKLDDTRDSRTQKRDSIDTRVNKKVVADRMIQLLTYKNHFMIDTASGLMSKDRLDEYLPITKYYIEHKDELDKKFSDVPIAKQRLIKINKGEESNGSGLTTVIKTMLKCGYLREINQCEQEILGSCEFDNHLNDYVDLSYNVELYCKEEHDDLKKITERSHIYYADYETDVTVSPHRPYLCAYAMIRMWYHLQVMIYHLDSSIHLRLIR